MPNAYQHMFRAAAREANLQMLARYDHRNSEALGPLVSKGITLVPFSREILGVAEKAGFELYEDYVLKHQHFRSIYKQRSHFRETILRWNQLGQLNQASLVNGQGDRFNEILASAHPHLLSMAEVAMAEALGHCH